MPLLLDAPADFDFADDFDSEAALAILFAPQPPISRQRESARRSVTVCPPCAPDCNCLDCQACEAHEQREAAEKAAEKAALLCGQGSDYRAFMVAEMEAAHRRWEALTPAVRAGHDAWNAYADTINARSIAA